MTAQILPAESSGSMAMGGWNYRLLRMLIISLLIILACNLPFTPEVWFSSQTVRLCIILSKATLPRNDVHW